MDVVSPTAIFPSFADTTVKRLVLGALKMPSAIDSPLNPGAAVCSVERLTLDSPFNFSVWLPFFRKSLPHWNELKVVTDLRSIHRWNDLLRTCDLSHLRRLHVSVCPEPYYLTTPLFPHDASPFFSSVRNLDHLLLTTRISDGDLNNCRIEVVSSMVEWYLCTFTALYESGKSMLKELTLTVMALDDPDVAAAWAKVDDILSTNAYSMLEHVHFLDKTKKTYQDMVISQHGEHA
ncbi:hypothetical protein BDZ89DRAFT_798134 [Hymenopellis radicata]|nr:hypothetical protein BDZ89DRAFT_798134 [Hymenopellis radicata]